MRVGQRGHDRGSVTIGLHAESLRRPPHITAVRQLDGRPVDTSVVPRRRLPKQRQLPPQQVPAFDHRRVIRIVASPGPCLTVFRVHTYLDAAARSVSSLLVTNRRRGASGFAEHVGSSIYRVHKDDTLTCRDQCTLARLAPTTLNSTQSAAPTDFHLWTPTQAGVPRCSQPSGSIGVEARLLVIAS